MWPPEIASLYELALALLTAHQVVDSGGFWLFTLGVTAALNIQVHVLCDVLSSLPSAVPGLGTFVGHVDSTVTFQETARKLPKEMPILQSCTSEPEESQPSQNACCCHLSSWSGGSCFISADLRFP